MSYKKKYLKYKEKYLVLKAGAQNTNNNENLNINYIYEDYDAYYSMKEEDFIKRLINDSNNYNHIPFRSYDDNNRIFISERLNDENRFDQLKENIDIQIYMQQNCEKYLNGLVNWLFYKVWTKYCIHGDLTENNLIVDFDEHTVYVIDWHNMEIHNIYYIKNRCTFYLYLLIDVYDIINSFSESFNITDYDNLKKNLEQIKELEEELKYNKLDPVNYVKENQTFLKNITEIIDATFKISFSKFIRFLFSINSK
jgi:hypothetical protein